MSLTTLGSQYSQPFNSLALSGTSSTVPTGWFFSEAGTNANTTYTGGTGSSGAGDTYSFGAASVAERAFGQLRSGTLISTLGACFTNNTGATITGLAFDYFGEQWRIGVNGAARDDRMDFQYSLNATSLTTGTWTNHDALDFTNLVKTAAPGSAGALDGNNAANRTNLISTIPALSIANGATFWIRWVDIDASGADDGLGIDDFFLTPQGAPPLPTLNINDVTQAETNAGTTTFTFTVSLTAPAGPGGVVFDIATQDNTAQDDNPVAEDNDYVANTPPPGQTIPAGSSTYSFNVTVNGDTNIEGPESFFVNVTNITGATPGDTQGQGNIQNDDSPTLNIDDVSQVEGPGGTSTFTFTVSLTQPAGPGGVIFDITTADNTATTADSDYVANTPPPGQTIPAGSSTYSFNVTVNGDNNVEPTESFFVNVSNITGATAGDVQGVGTIVTDEPLITIDNVTQAELNSGTSTFTFTVSLSIPAPPGGVTFDIATAPNTATAGTDYVHRAETAQTITAGNSTYTFDVTVNGDATFEPNETFFVNISNVSPGAGVSDGQGTGTITNDDAQPMFSIADVALTEGNAGTQIMTFTISLSGTRDASMDVNVATADNSATVADNDYVANATILSFAPSDTTKTFNVTINGDTNPEGNEQFFVNLTSPTGGATISDAQALGIIRLDDPFSIAAVDTPYLENFDVLAQTTAATTPVGWTQEEGDTNANFTYSASTGSSTAGDTYSFGVAGVNPITDRAYGQLFSGSLDPTIGAFYRNDTPTTITSLSIQYVGEEWRVGTAGRADRLDFQYSLDATSLSTGTWINVDQLDFSTPNQTSLGAKDGNAAANRTPRVHTITGLSIAPGSTFWVRFNDFDASGSDDGLAVDNWSIIANFSGAFLSVDDVQQFEGNAGTTTYTFTVTLTQPAPGPGGVNFTVDTVDGTAVAPGDYTAISGAGFNIPAGGTSTTFNVTVNGDATPEASETFFVNLTNITGALPADPQGQGTIIDEDTPITMIHTIQGSGSASGMVGASVKIRGIVTGVKNNGFFVQEEDAEAAVEGNPATSEGIFVFTNSSPAPSIVLGAEVMVNGTVAEFVPGADPFQPPLTELTAPSTVVLSTGNALPLPVLLSAAFPNPAGSFDQLERVEGMRVQVNSLTVTGPTDGSFSEVTGSVSHTGRFWGVVTGVPRPFREPGIRQPDPPASGSIPPIPRWDTNPELLKIDSNGLGAGSLVVKASDTVAPIVGPLEYSFRFYTILPDGTAPSTVTPGTLNPNVTPPLSNEITVVSFNLNRLFNDDNTDGPPAATDPAFYQNRLGKASRAIRDNLRTPDIIGVQEVETLSVLQDLAARINSDAVTAAQPDPMYVAHLIEGNDIGGIDVGFLVKTGNVATGLPRVTNIVVTQELDGTTWIDPRDNVSRTLHDRPPLVLDARVNRAPGVFYDITVINNHLRSLNDIESNEISGLTTEGDRVRKKRLAQAQDLANLVQSYQTANASRNIILIGDLNAFEFNDGLVDVVNTIAGTPPPDNETVVPGDGIDLVNPNLDNLVDTPPPSERYSYVHEGNAQNLDHALVNQALINSTTARRIEHPRIDADYPETERNNPATPIRISDHDPVIAYLLVAAASDFAVTLTHPTGFATAGTNTSYTINVTNNGPDAGNASMSVNLTAGTTFQSITPPVGWTCPTTPSMGGTGMVTCTTTAPMAAGPGGVNFTLTVGIDPSLAANTVLTRTATVDGANDDPNGANDSENEDVTVITASQYFATKTVSGPTFRRGDAITYSVTIFNNKPFTQPDNPGNELTDVLPSGVTLVSASATSGTAVATIATNTVTWNGSIASGGSVTITINATIDADASGVQSNQATISDDADNNGTNERNGVSDDPGAGGTADPTNFTVTSAAVTGTKTVSGTFVSGTNVTYTVVLTNNMGLAQPDNSQHEFTDVLPAGLTFVSAGATSGTASFVAGTTVVWNGSLAANGGTVTITFVAQINPSASGTISNQGTVHSDTNNDANNDTDTLTDNPATPAANDPTNFTVVPANSFMATKRITAGSFIPGGSVTYQVVLTNGLPHTLADNPGDEFTDVLPPQIQLVSASATSGTAVATTGTNTVTWNGSIPSGGTVTITIDATIPSNATAGTVSNQGTANVDLDNNGSNETAVPTDDPDVAGQQATSFVISTPSQVVATKSASGSFIQGGSVTYTIVITNNTSHQLDDNPGNEFTDVLPAPLQLLTAGATSGTATANTGTNTVTWNGAIPAGGSVTITIDASIPANASGTITNQGQVSIDLDDNGTNETNVPTDDPDTPGTQATAFGIATPSQVTATKSVSTGGVGGDVATYTIVVTNNTGNTLPDNTGDELVDVLPPEVQVENATATSGVASFDIATNTVRWNGSLADGASVTITITTRIAAGATGPVSNQATFNADLDGDGDNETAITTNTATFQAAAFAAIPALSPLMLLALAAMLAVVAWKAMR